MGIHMNTKGFESMSSARGYRWKWSLMLKIIKRTSSIFLVLEKACVVGEKVWRIVQFMN